MIDNAQLVRYLTYNFYWLSNPSIWSTSTSAGLVGYITNVIALEMTFHPIEYFGINLFRIKNQPWGIFGWQGIIPTKAEKMASVTFDLMTTKLLDMKEIFDRLDPVKFAQVMEDATLLMLDDIINEIAMQYIPKRWLNLPQDVKDELIVAISIESDEFLLTFMEELKARIDDVLDLKQMIVSAIVREKQLMVQVFQECGKKEFTFIRRSGFYFGFVFGLVQMGVFFVYNANWVLPIFGFLVGWATNWLALKVIFRPQDPHTLGPLTIHGLFYKRQNEVSDKFARITCVEVLHTKAIWERILTGPRSQYFYAMVSKNRV